ncbi:MAG: hypothetical protein IPN17_08430 [Deltaproteobacteria bacterium]|nr:hypothetical protein [Deltaproteobacteria bacterium]MBK8692315.1 hypothetical protein [Deltaproteobacteria bacterium]MBP6831740.1 hypothetical protein [Deltaproteobacteria bacterium]
MNDPTPAIDLSLASPPQRHRLLGDDLGGVVGLGRHREVEHRVDSGRLAHARLLQLAEGDPELEGSTGGLAVRVAGALAFA